MPEARLVAVRSIAASEGGVVRLTRPACIRLRQDRGGRGENALIRALPFGRVRLQAWAADRDPFRRGETLAHVLTREPQSSWWSAWIGVLVFAKNTPLRVMRMDPELELWPPNLPPIGHRWRKLESLLPDAEVIL